MASKKPAPSSAETTLRIKQLLKKLPEERADAARLDELRRLFAKLVSSGQLSFDTNTTYKRQGLADRQMECVSTQTTQSIRLSTMSLYTTRTQDCHSYSVWSDCRLASTGPDKSTVGARLDSKHSQQHGQNHSNHATRGIRTTIS